MIAQWTLDSVHKFKKLLTFTKHLRVNLVTFNLFMSVYPAALGNQLSVKC